jgi:hypothetical protein
MRSWEVEKLGTREMKMKKGLPPGKPFPFLFLSPGPYLVI